LTAGRDGVVLVWDVAIGATVGRFEAGAAVRSASFGDRGRLLLVASADGVARIWEAEGARLRNAFRHTSLAGAAFSPDSELVVTWGGPTARVWHVGEDAKPLVLRGHRGSVVSAAFSPDGKRVVTAGEDGTARIWDVSTGRLLHTLVGHREALTDAQFSADGAIVVTASLDTDARTWDAETGRPLQVLRGHFSKVSSASFNPDGRWVVTASATTAGLWRTNTGRLLFYLRGHEAALTTATFSPDGTRILTASVDKTVRIYDCEICPGIPGLLELADRRLRSTSLR
jgi:WD40 repeat protein